MLVILQVPVNYQRNENEAKSTGQCKQSSYQFVERIIPWIHANSWRRSDWSLWTPSFLLTLWLVPRGDISSCFLIHCGIPFIWVWKWMLEVMCPADVLIWNIKWNKNSVDPLCKYILLEGSLWFFIFFATIFVRDLQTTLSMWTYAWEMFSC